MQANVTPILQNGKPRAARRRIKPSRQISRQPGVHAGERGSESGTWLTCMARNTKGIRGLVSAFHRISPTGKFGIALAGMAGAGILPRVLGIQGLAAFGAEFTALLVGAVLTLLWFHRSFTVAVSEAQRFANDLAGCNLTTAVASDFAPPMGALIRSLRQIQINLQAVVGDVRGEIASFTQSAAEIAAGGMDLSARTESQASSLEQTAASMEQISSTVRQTASTAAEVSTQSTKSTDAAKGGDATKSRSAMQAIETSSARCRKSSRDWASLQTILALSRGGGGPG